MVRQVEMMEVLQCSQNAFKQWLTAVQDDLTRGEEVITALALLFYGLFF